MRTALLQAVLNYPVRSSFSTLFVHVIRYIGALFKVSLLLSSVDSQRAIYSCLLFLPYSVVHLSLSISLLLLNTPLTGNHGAKQQ